MQNYASFSCFVNGTGYSTFTFTVTNGNYPALYEYNTTSNNINTILTGNTSKNGTFSYDFT